MTALLRWFTRFVTAGSRCPICDVCACDADERSGLWQATMPRLPVRTGMATATIEASPAMELAGLMEGQRVSEEVSACAETAQARCDPQSKMKRQDWQTWM